MPFMTLKDGTNINYEVLGSGPPVLLTPGGRSDMNRARAMADAVASAGYQAILHDRRNCGASDVVIARRYDPSTGSGRAQGKELSEQELFVEDAYELVTNLGVTPVWSAGVSAGCRLSIMLAVRHPRAVKGLIVWRVSGGPIAAERLSRQYYGAFIEVAIKEGMAGVLRTPFFAERAQQNPASGDRLLKMDVKEFVAIMRDWQDFLLVDQPVAGATEEEMRRINVPTMINHMVSHPEARSQDLSCLRLATSAGEALPIELYHRWKETFGVELLDGLGTAEMWHIFVSNRADDVRPGTLGKAVPGFEVRVCDADGRELPAGETGWLWVRGESRAIGYWQNMEKTKDAFRGEWYVSGDMIRKDADGYITFAGRGDDMLKVSGKWVAPQEVENCLLRHPEVREVAVVGVMEESGLTKPRAYVVAREPHPGLDEELKTFVREHLEPYKYPREVVFLDVLPRTHLGKVDRAKLRSG